MTTYARGAYRAPRKQERDAPSILPKTYDPHDGMIRWRSGPIPGQPDYALTKTGACVRTGNRILNKKERRRDKAAQEKYSEGYRFVCTCKALTFHFPSNTKVKVKGYEKLQEMETYECSVCGEHFDRERIDAAVAAHHEREENKDKPKVVNFPKPIPLPEKLNISPNINRPEVDRI